jgi:hypothetical protein
MQRGKSYEPFTITHSPLTLCNLSPVCLEEDIKFLLTICVCDQTNEKKTMLI